MKILAIETSCDDTAITIMEVKGSIQNPSFRVLANNSNSQIKIHRRFGGVYPALAKREHIKNLPILLKDALKQAKINLIPRLPLKEEGAPSPFRRGLGRGKSPVDLITVTHGPGLEPALWAGITFAQELAEKWQVPIMPVNHMEGHIFSVFGKNKGKFKVPQLKFPMLSLLVSGGHTQLVLAKKFMHYEIIGETLDDAVGEAFDKVARMLGLPYPGGPEISRLAEKARKSAIPLLRGALRNRRAGWIVQSTSLRLRRSTPQEENKEIHLPRPMLHTKDFNFSFSGLKTAVLYLIRDLSKKHSNILQNDKIKQAIALEFENAAVECLVHKTKKALEKYKAQTLIVAGGVAANKYLRKEMKKIAGRKIKLFFPTPELSGDNAIMIGMAGYLNYLKNKNLPAQAGRTPKPELIKAVGNLRL